MDMSAVEVHVKYCAYGRRELADVVSGIVLIYPHLDVEEEGTPRATTASPSSCQRARHWE